MRISNPTSPMKSTGDDKVSRREILKIFGAGAASLTLPWSLLGCRSGKDMPRHIVTLSFDDGFEKSSIRTAEIFEKYNLSACINVIATAHQQDFELRNKWHDWPVGDFSLWNELKARGHEIMPHSYKHANLREAPLSQAQDLILRCLDYFSKNLNGFEPKESVFNFPFNQSSHELEEWLVSQVRAFRTGGNGINLLPQPGRAKLLCFGPATPDNIDADVRARVDELLAQPSGWLIYNAHGLDDEGWGPMTASFLDNLLAALVEMESVAILSTGKALASTS